MEPKYCHTQQGYVIYFSAILVILLCGGIVLLVQPYWLGLLIGVLTCFLLSLFFTLTVSVSEEIIECSYSWNLIRRSILLSDVQKVSIVQNPWYWGWGIKLIPQGWMWNVSGLMSVELTYYNGRHFRIGTDEPDKLCHAIEEVLGGKNAVQK